MIAVVVLGVRLAWMFVVPAIAHLRIVPREPTGLPERLVLGWSGMRGARLARRGAGDPARRSRSASS